MVVVDRLSKYAHFSALSHPYTTATVVDVFVRDIVKFHGMPPSIISDRDPFSLVIFGKPFLSSKVLSYVEVLLIIHNRMVKQRSLIGLWSVIYVAMLVINLLIG